VARKIADLQKAADIGTTPISEAISYPNLDRGRAKAEVSIVS
jgi:hypothetical protein